MPSLDTLQSSQVVKLLLIGDSGTGKTGSLASLVKAGYKLRILDMDVGWESLAGVVQRDCPELASTVDVISYRDDWKSSPGGPILDGFPKAFLNALKVLDNWPEFGPPKQWGPNCILVVDSLTFLSDAAYNWCDALDPNIKDKRAIFYSAQKAIEKLLAMLTSPNFKTNVIIISHIKYVDMPDGTKKGYPTAVGSALSPEIARYLNSTLQCQTNSGGIRTIQTQSTGLVDLKNPKSFILKKTLPIETGLATFFETLKGLPSCQPSQTSLPEKSETLKSPSPSLSEPTSPSPKVSPARISLPKKEQILLNSPSKS